MSAPWISVCSCGGRALGVEAAEGVMLASDDPDPSRESIDRLGVEEARNIAEAPSDGAPHE